jgi:putative lipoic acid-binding regulatory protein
MEGDFDKLKAQLEEMSWPQIYFFKFICPADSQTIARISSLFDNRSDLNIRESSKGNYVSISTKEVKVSAAAVIHVYEEAAKIKGVISL